MVVGKHTYGHQNIRIHGGDHVSSGKLFIGSYCSIAGEVSIFLGANHRSDWFTTYPFGHINKELFTSRSADTAICSSGDVVIGNDVWIGLGSTIMSGVTVGDGAIIAAKSHVVKNVEPYSIIGGNPAKLIKYRFSPEARKLLLDFEWWNLNDEQVNNLIPILQSSDESMLTDTILNYTK